jgi:Calpain family cysteine protease/GRF zinc finger
LIAPKHLLVGMTSIICPKGIDPTVWNSLPTEIQNELSLSSTNREQSSSSSLTMSVDNLGKKRKADKQSTGQSSITFWTKTSTPPSVKSFQCVDLTSAESDQRHGMIAPTAPSPVVLSVENMLVKGKPKTCSQQLSLFPSESKYRGSVDLFVDTAFPAGPESIDGRHSATSMADGNTDSNSQSNQISVCKCKMPVKIRQVSKDGVNQGRYFASCLSRQCNHFAWADSVPHTESVSKLTWKRFHKYDGWSLFGSKGIYGISPNDVFQGGVGDCWFLSAVAVLAERFDLVQKVIQDSELSTTGKITFNLFIDGLWRKIEVDSSLPCVSKDSLKRSSKSSADKVTDSLAVDPDGSHLAYAKANHKQLWVPLLEKAYAKAHGESK